MYALFTNFEIMTSPSKSKIYFFFEKRTSLENRSGIKKLLESIFKEEGKRLKCLNYIFCSDEYLRAINKTYLRHDYYTDIVTFELSEKPKPIEGEVYISVDRVAENSLSFRVPLKRELHRVMIHAVLHLCGYDDKTRSKKNEMTAREDFYLASYF